MPHDPADRDPARGLRPAVPWNVVAIVVGCLLEIGEIVVLRNWSKRMGKRAKPTTGAEAMIGKVAEVTEECRPTGIGQAERRVVGGPVRGRCRER